MPPRADFFVSYTQADRSWAEWIAWQLEANGYRIIIQAWDFAAGRNFVVQMDEASGQSARTIAVLSSDYLASQFATSEWAAAFARDPTGQRRTLIPVRVGGVAPSGLLAAIVWVDLVDCDEDTARARLLAAAIDARAKPIGKPPYPPRAAAETTSRPRFPREEKMVEATAPANPESKAVADAPNGHRAISTAVRVERRDTWAVVGSILCSLFLFAAVLLVPFFARAMLTAPATYATLWFLVVSGFLLGAVATGYVGYDLPSGGNARNPYISYIWFCLVPLAFSSIHLNTFWAFLPLGSAAASWFDIVGRGKSSLTLWHFGFFGALMHSGGMTAGILLARWRFHRPQKLTGTHSTLVAATGFGGGLLAYRLTRSTIAGTFDVTDYVCLAFPVFISTFLFTGTLLVGVTSRELDERDREWWARSGGAAFSLGLAWPVAAAIMLYSDNTLVFAHAESATAFAAAATGWAVLKLAGSAATALGRDGNRTVLAGFVSASWIRNVATRLVLAVFIVLLMMCCVWLNSEVEQDYALLLKDTEIMLVMHGTGLAVHKIISSSPILLTMSDCITPLLLATAGVLWIGTAYLTICVAVSYFTNIDGFSFHRIYEQQRLNYAYLVGMWKRNGSRTAHRTP